MSLTGPTMAQLEVFFFSDHLCHEPFLFHQSVLT